MKQQTTLFHMLSMCTFLWHCCYCCCYGFCVPYISQRRRMLVHLRNDHPSKPSMFVVQQSIVSRRYVYDNRMELVEEEKEEEEESAKVLMTTTTTTDRIEDGKDEVKVRSKMGVEKDKVARGNVKENAREKLDLDKAFNVVLTHCTADFDTLASAMGLAKLWSTPHARSNDESSSSSGSSSSDEKETFDNHTTLPTYVVLPRGAHPSVQRFLALHEHLFPIRTLKSLTEKSSVKNLVHLNRIGLVDAQRKDRIGPADILLKYARHITIVDHHVDAESDIIEMASVPYSYVIDKVGAVSTMITEKLKESEIDITEAEATLLALGIHGDTGSLCYDSTTARDAMALAYCLEKGASQAAIAENTQATLSTEQQQVLTQVMLNTNSTVIHGVTVSTVLLSTEGFINGLAAVTQDALELSSSDVYLLAVVYDTKFNSNKNNNDTSSMIKKSLVAAKASSRDNLTNVNDETINQKIEGMAEAWRGGKDAMRRTRLKNSFNRKDTDNSGFLDKDELAAALSSSGIIASQETVDSVFELMDTDGNGKIDFEEFVAFADQTEEQQRTKDNESGKKSSNMIVIGRVKAGISVKSVNLNNLFEQFGGGGHAKAASTTIRLTDESQAEVILQNLVDELITTSLLTQPPVGDFMTAPVLSAKPEMTEKEVEYLFNRFDVRALPVVDDDNNVIGLVTYKEVAAAKQRLLNKEQKREKERARKNSKNGGKIISDNDETTEKRRKLGSALKGWMLQHVTVVEASKTLNDVEAMLLDNDVGCIPVVADGSMELVGMVTRTDLLRQHRYYPSLHYHNKAFSDSIAARKPIIELRKKLKKFDIEE